MKGLIFAATCALLAVRPLSAPSIAGDWAGSVDTGTSRFLLMLRVSQSGGRLHASFDGLDQNATGIPFSSVSQDGVDVNFASTSAHVSYRGKASPDGNRIEGTWTQQVPRSLTWKRVAHSDIAGAWTGAVDTPARQLHLIFHIEPVAGGFLAAMDVPDQHAAGIESPTGSCGNSEHPRRRRLPVLKRST